MSGDLLTLNMHIIIDRQKRASENEKSHILKVFSELMLLIKMSQEVTSTGHALLEQFWGEQHQAVVGERIGEPEEHTQGAHTLVHTIAKRFKMEDTQPTPHPPPSTGKSTNYEMNGNIMITKEEEL